MAFSRDARKSASIARSIKQLLGTAAYERYKQSGTYDRSALEAARLKKMVKKTTNKVPSASLPTDRVQADVRTDIKGSRDPAPDEFLKKLKQGDAVRSCLGRRRLA